VPPVHQALAVQQPQPESQTAAAEDARIVFLAGLSSGEVVGE
jgi:hypothetical protein